MRLVRFGVVSGVGWTLDFLVFSLLVYLGTAPWLANALGATLAVIWVYAASVRRIFRYGGASLHGTFAAYAAFQVVGIAAASWAVGALVAYLGVPPLLAKVLVTPGTFLANYLFMAWLTVSPSAGTGNASGCVASIWPERMCQASMGPTGPDC